MQHELRAVGDMKDHHVLAWGGFNADRSALAARCRDANRMLDAAANHGAANCACGSVRGTGDHKGD